MIRSSVRLHTHKPGYLDSAVKSERSLVTSVRFLVMLFELSCDMMCDLQ